MARTKPLSPAAKRRSLLRLEAKLRRDLDKVSDKLAHCLTCDAEKLNKEVRRLEAKHTKERAKLASRLGVEASELEAQKPTKSKTSAAKKKKTAKKKAAKKMTAKKTAKKKTSKKKTAKKVTKKKTAKKATKKSSQASLWRVEG